MERKKTSAVTCNILSSAEFLGNENYAIWDCYSEYESSFNNRLHFHDFYELSVIYEGSSNFLVNGSAFDMGEKSMQLVRPSDYHRQQTGKGKYIRYFNIVFSGDFISEALRQKLEEEQSILCVNVENDEWENLMRLVEKAYEACRDQLEE